MTANQTTLNDTEVEHDLGEREEKMREVGAMLREMRHRNSSTQRAVAEREKAEADKRKDTTASTIGLWFRLMFRFFLSLFLTLSISLPPPIQSSSVWTSNWPHESSRTTPRPSESESVWPSSTNR